MWGLLVAAGALGCAVATRRMFRNGVPQRPPHYLVAAMAISGLTWGSIPVIAMPITPAYQAFTGMMIFGPLAANVLFSSSVPRLYWAFHLALVTVAGFGYLVSTTETRLATIIVLLYTLPFGLVMSRIKLRTDEQGVYFALVNELIVAELSTSNEQLTIEASRDSLTGLSNRTDFISRLEVAMDASSRSTCDVGLLFLDLDHFKVVNDSLGHAAGDALLVAVAERINHVLRPTDLLGRLGGDEFTVLIPEIHDLTEVENVAHRVLRAFDEPFEINGRRHPMSVSIGVSYTGDLGLSAADLLRLADAALYKAKGEGRDRVSVYDAALRAHLDRRLDDEAELREGLAAGQFSGWFQPIVHLTTGAIVAAEGLVRWEHPAGIRQAGEFISLATEVGLDFTLSTTVLGDLRRLQHRLRSAGANIDLGFNLPPVHLLELLELFDEQEDLTGLTIEITENGLIADVDAAAKRLQDVQRRGASIWLDDFGQGQSSMSLLTQLPLDAVKIDRHFVSDVVNDPTSRAIVSAIAEIGQNLGYHVVAEGVETVDQANVLRQLGATHGQGFLFSPALPVDDFIELESRLFSYADVLGVSSEPVDPIRSALQLRRP